MASRGMSFFESLANSSDGKAKTVTAWVNGARVDEVAMPNRILTWEEYVELQEAGRADTYDPFKANGKAYKIIRRKRSR